MAGSPLLSRRRFSALALLAGVTGARGARARDGHEEGPEPKAEPAPRPSDGIDTPEMALAELIVGNKRFVAGKRTRSADTTRDPQTRAELADEQRPFAVIVTCSDSRVPETIVFDQEPGRLFTIREAGNGVDQQGLASVDYGVDHLGAKVVVVLGHTGCGAVKAVQVAKGKPLPGSFWVFQTAMAGLLETTPQAPKETDRVYGLRLVEANARRQAQAIKDRSEVVRERLKKNKVWVVPAVYELHSGTVRFFDRVRLEPAIAKH